MSLHPVEPVEPVHAVHPVHPVQPGGSADQPLPLPELWTLAPALPALRRSAPGAPRPTARERHDEKITVYVSTEELLSLERARLTLRAEHGLVADRGRMVREAVAVVLADLDAKGGDSILVRRLRDR